MTKSTEVRLKQRPKGTPVPEDFELVETDVPEPGDGEALVENLFMSVDPYMRGRMTGVKTYVDPFEVGAVLEGGAVGRVVASSSPALGKGDLVLSQLGWRERFVAPARRLMRIEVPEGVEPQAFLGVLGMPGMTAWYGLTRIGEPKQGDRVFVSGAAGAVGSIVCQLGKALGCHVVGSAGSAAKVRWLIEEAGVDGAFDYHETPPKKALRELAPQGIDVYFENVGGDHLEAAIGRMRDFGRIVMCGLISQYNAEIPPPGPRNLAYVVSRRLKMQGFIVTDHMDLHGEFLREVGALVREGKITWKETVRDGIGEAPAAFIGLFEGENLGKMLVRLAD